MLTPINDHILVRRAERPTESAGGVILPDTVRTAEADEGYVIGLAAHGISTDRISIGDRVVFKAYGACELEIDGEKVLLLPTKNVIGVYAQSD
jgi:chaperonin GroES